MQSRLLSRVSFLTTILVLVGTSSHDQLWAQQGAELVENVSREPAVFTSPPRMPLAGAGDRLVVTVADAWPSQRTTVWSSDGTADGTAPHHRFCAFDQCIEPVFLERAFGGIFLAVVWSNETEIWWTDGTAAGLRRIHRGGATVELGLTADGRYLFAATSQTGPAPVTVVRQVDDSLTVSVVDTFEGFLGSGLVVGDAAIYLRPGSDSKDALWLADGGGARSLVEFGDGGVNLGLRGFDEFALVQRLLPDSSIDVWGSDGTRGGTERLLEAVPSATILGGDEIAYLAILSGSDVELWASEGRRSATRRLNTFRGFDAAVGLGVAVADTFFFPASTTEQGSELWRTDGTVAGTGIVRDLCAGPCRSNPARLTAADGGAFFTEHRDGSSSIRVYFASDTGRIQGPLLPELFGGVFFVPFREGALIVTPEELWFSDGSPSGTVLLERLEDGRSFQASPDTILALDDRAFFVLRDASLLNPPSLWQTNGTAAGTFPVAELAPQRLDTGSQPRWLGTFEDRLAFFTFDSGDAGQRVWRTDGTSVGTRPELGLPEPIDDGELIGNRLVMIASPTLYVIDLGTNGPPTELVDIVGGVLNTVGRVGSRVLFFSRGAELWSSNGTAAGTSPIASGIQPAGGFNVQFLDTARGAVIPVMAGEGSELWLSNGVASGTRRVADLPAGVLVPDSQSGRWWATRGDDLYLLDLTYRLLRVDLGSGSVTTLHEPSTLRTSGERLELVVVGDRVLFVAPRAHVGDFELWISDGTPAGTRPLIDLWPGPVGSRPRELTVLDGVAYFSADTPGTGRELWRSDGTATGTVRVADLYPGSPGSQPTSLRALDGSLLFAADDGVTGFELWQSDGSAAGTFRLTDIAPASASSDPRPLTVLGDSLLVAADDGRLGEELWRVDSESALGCQASSSRLCLQDGRLGIEVSWRNPRDGVVRAANAVRFPGSDETGSFWFFDEDNVELLVKTLDGGSLNGRFWVFYGALSNVEYRVRVEDFATGQVQEYLNPQGTLCGGADIDAFPSGVGAMNGTSVSHDRASPHRAGLGSTDLVLNAGRFRVEVEWHAPFTGASGIGRAIRGTDDSGFFWFFNAENVELAVKVLDARVINGHFWVFFGALTDVEYSVTVTDLETGSQRVYTNPAGTLCGQADTEAF